MIPKHVEDTRTDQGRTDWSLKAKNALNIQVRDWMQLEDSYKR